MGDSAVQDDLGEIIARSREQVHTLANEGIQCLQDVAAEFNDKRLALALDQVVSNLAADRFRLIVVGRFNNGKSTLLNAMLGEPEKPVDFGGADLLPSHRRPTTAVLTDIIHSDDPFARIYRLDGTSEQLTLEQFRIESRVRNTSAENAAFFDSVRRFEVGFPAKLLRSVTLSDSPGISDVPVRTAITREAVDESDAALAVYRTETPAGHDELEFVAEVKASGCRLFSVVNVIWPDTTEDPDLLKFMWDRLVGSHRDKPPTLEEFEQLDIFFVDALAALKSRREHNPEKLEKSGLPRFEQRLGEFLLKEKFVTHTARYISRAERIADSLEQNLRTREMAHRANAADLRAMIDRLRPQVDQLRHQRRALDLTIGRYAQVFAATAQQSFVDFIQTLREPLIEELNEEAYALESLKNWGGTKAIVSTEQRERIGKELVGHIITILGRRVTAWASDENEANGLIAALNPDFQRLTEEIETQVRRMDETIKEGRLELLSDVDDDPFGPLSGISDSIAAHMVGDFGERGKIGALVGGGLASLLVATIGLKISLVIGSAILVALGIALNPLLILGIIVAAMIGGGGLVAGLGMEKKIKKKAVDAVIQTLPINHDAISNLKQTVISKYQVAIAPVSEAIGSAIEDEERRLQTLIDVNESDSSKQASELDRMASLFALVAKARASLTEARQGLDSAL